MVDVDRRISPFAIAFCISLVRIEAAPAQADEPAFLVTGWSIGARQLAVAGLFMTSLGIRSRRFIVR